MAFSHTLGHCSDFQLELSTTLSLCEELNTPRALYVYLLIKNEEWRLISELECNPEHYQDVSHFADDYLVSSLLKKSVNLPLPIDRAQVAKDAFYAAEAKCAQVNAQFSDLSQPLPECFHQVKALLHKVLGPLRKKDLDYAERHFRFGPGATTAVKGLGIVLSDKYDEEIHLTTELYPFYKSILGSTWWEKSSSPVIVEGSKFTTVPKNAKTDRGIGIEPTLNIYVQLGIGALLRQRLLDRLGIDLRYQDKNQILASVAQALGLATIDLKAASDSISYELVKALLPWDWFVFLSTPRSERIEVEKGSYHLLEKFSAMGNGYTFELETLIFACVCFSIVPKHEHAEVSVYGDDLIVPQTSAPAVVDALNSLGFSVNTEKSFLAGAFFESCGTDWFHGQSVRPFYLRRNRKSQIPYALQIANSIRLYASQRGNGLNCDVRFRSTWSKLSKLVPRPWSNRIPKQLGDSGLIVPLSESGPLRTPSGGLEGWLVRQVNLKPKEVRKTSLGRLLAALACPDPEISTRGREARRGLFGVPAQKLTLVHDWSDCLVWSDPRPALLS